MDKGKMIPLGLTFILILVAIGIFFYSHKKEDGYSKLTIKYAGQENEYNTFKVDDLITVNNTNFWVVSTEGNAIVLQSDKSLLENNEESMEFKIELNKVSTICVKDNDCIYFELV